MDIGIIELLKLLIRWLFDRKVRLHLAGYRPEIICLIEDKEQQKYLLIKPKMNPSVWVPPHEGINLHESIESAVVRCLNIELGIKENQIQFRKSMWLTKRILPEERWDERDLPFSLRGLFSKKKMVGKAYFGALIFTNYNVEININPAEVVEYKWVNSKEYFSSIATNNKNKQEILVQLWNRII